MANTIIKWILISLAWLSMTRHSVSQNLVPNPSFESYTTCPEGFGQGGLLQCTPWQNANLATSDYFNVCADLTNVSVPNNHFGYQEARTGVAYAGCIWSYYPGLDEWSECIQIQLVEPLMDGYFYNISFYVSLSNNFNCAIEEIGVYISAGPPSGNTTGPLDVVPQIEADIGFVSDTQNWVLISGCYPAQGDEQWITIGNFSPLNELYCTYSYYYIDDVSVTQGDLINSLDLELGDPVIACVFYEIDPGITGVSYNWSTGSVNPTLIVTESGMYSLTISDGCNTSIDSIDVFFDGVPEGVDLGPPEITICNGDSYTISLDADLGDYLWQDGTTDPDYTITTPGIYQVSFDDGCDVTTDEINIAVMNMPAPFSLGGDAFLCPGDEILFSFDPALGDFEWQDGSTSTEYTINTDGIYALTISNACGEYSNDMEVLEISLPSLDLGPPQLTFCEGQSIDISLNPDLGDYIWQDGSTSSSYAILEAGLYAVTISNECGFSSDTLEAIMITQPLFDLTSDHILCAGQTITLDGSGVTGNYLWQDSSTASTFLVSVEGTYSLTVTNQCGTGSDSVTISYVDSLATPDLGPDLDLCPGEQSILYAGISGVNYTWQDSSNADSLVVVFPGTYFLQIANICSTTSDTVVVSLDDNPPVVDLPSSINLCSGDTVVIDAGISGVQYVWNDGSQLSSITVSDPGSYSVTVSNACGVGVDTVVIVDAGFAPFVSLSEDLSICPGETVMVTPVSSDVISWLWQDGSTGSTYEVSSAGLIIVQAGNHCGFDTDTMLVSLLPPTPTLDLGADTSLCPGEILTLSINIPDVEITWSDGSTNSTYAVSDAELVHAVITNQCGSSSDSLLIELLPPAPNLNLGIDQSLCPGDTILLSPEIAGVDYLWHDGSTSTSFNATLPGIVILSVTNSCGTAIDTVVIIEDTNGPEVHLGEDVMACVGEVVTLSAGISGVDYLWQDGSTLIDFSTSVSGTFILQVSNACGLDTDTVMVDISGQIPVPSLGPDTALCEGTSIQLLSNVDAQSTLQWQDGSTLPIFSVSTPGLYTLSASNHCGQSTDSILIAYELLPEQFDLGPDTVLCPGEFIILQAPATSALITWQDGSHGPTMIADRQQAYSLQISNRCGIVMDDLEISFDDRVPVVDIDEEIFWCEEDVIILDATQSFEAAYLWNNGSILSSIEVLTPGIYAVNVTTPCQTVQHNVEVLQRADCNTDIYIPSVFSPNGDQVNDVFTVSVGTGMNIIHMECRIFDRWGNNVLHTDEMNVNWDGRFRNEELMPGVYVYLIKLKFTFQGSEREQMYSGDITLLR